MRIADLFGISDREIKKMEREEARQREARTKEGKDRYAANKEKRVWHKAGYELSEFLVTDQGVFFKVIGKTGKETQRRPSMMGVMDVDVDYDQPIHFTWAEMVKEIVFVEDHDLHKLTALTAR